MKAVADLPEELHTKSYLIQGGFGGGPNALKSGGASNTNAISADCGVQLQPLYSSINGTIIYLQTKSI